MKGWLAAVAFCSVGYAFADEATVRRVDLDRPGALENLKRENPAHYAKVERILREAPKLPLPTMAGWMQAQFDARQVSAPYLLKTSLPAQARISFLLDDTRYEAVIRVNTPK